MPPLGINLLASSLPPWGVYLLMGLIILTLISSAGFVLARLGFKPIWALALIVPVVQIGFFWRLALIAWPREKTKSE